MDIEHQHNARGSAMLDRRRALVAMIGSAAGAAAAARGRTAAADIAPYSAVEAPEWTALFNRREGWTGADGVYSIPLSGDERPGSGANSRTLILFSDTFVGSVRPNGSRFDTTLVNNTDATLKGAQPDPLNLAFHIRETGGQAAALVTPNPLRFEGQWFWPMDGVLVDGRVVMYGLRVKSAPTPPFAFATAGVSLLTASAADNAPFAGPYRQKDVPLFVQPQADSAVHEACFGLAVMPLTVQSGAPSPDGYLYVYGTRSGSYRKSLLVARVLPEQIDAGSAYRFWNGSDWVPHIRAAVNLTLGVSAEFSVQPLEDGRYLLVHMTDLLGSTVAVRYGASPVGPWGEDIPIWDCPEATLTPNTYVYGAKAHPHLSTPGSLLISYHVNTFDFAENFRAGGSDIYRPRFITVPLA
jgi:Domain of unknown function (DUF4185)